MRALSDALPTGHRAMTNPTLQLHFGCGRATPPVSHSHNWPSRRMQNFLFKIGQKSYFFANKDPQTNFDDWMILQKHVLSFQCNTFFKMANLKAISSSATLNGSIERHTYSLSDGYLVSMRAMYVHQHDVVQFPTHTSGAYANRTAIHHDHSTEKKTRATQNGHTLLKYMYYRFLCFSLVMHFQFNMFNIHTVTGINCKTHEWQPRVS